MAERNMPKLMSQCKRYRSRKLRVLTQENGVSVIVFHHNGMHGLGYERENAQVNDRDPDRPTDCEEAGQINMDTVLQDGRSERSRRNSVQPRVCSRRAQ
jgi:hypothetical protein